MKQYPWVTGAPSNSDPRGTVMVPFFLSVSLSEVDKDMSRRTNILDHVCPAGRACVAEYAWKF